MTVIVSCMETVLSVLARLSHEPAQGLSDERLHVFPMHDGVDHSVLEEEFAALESIRQFLFDGLFDNPRTRESDQCSGFGDVEIAEHGVAGGHSSRSRIRQYGYVWKALHVEIGKGRRNLCHLHQTQRSFLHARAART